MASAEDEEVGVVNDELHVVPILLDNIDMGILSVKTLKEYNYHNVLKHYCVRMTIVYTCMYMSLVFFLQNL